MGTETITKLPKWELRAVSIDEAKKFIRPKFQRELDGRPRNIAKSYLHYGFFTSSPITVYVDDEGKYYIIDGGHRWSAYMIACEKIKDMLIQVCFIKGCHMDMKEAFLTYNDSRTVSLNHKCLIHDAVTTVANEHGFKLAKSTSRTSISAVDFVKACVVYNTSSLKISKPLEYFERIANGGVLAGAGVVFNIATKYKSFCLNHKRKYTQIVVFLITYMESNGYSMSDDDIESVAQNCNIFNPKGSDKVAEKTEFSNALTRGKSLKEIKEIRAILHLN